MEFNLEHWQKEFIYKFMGIARFQHWNYKTTRKDSINKVEKLLTLMKQIISEMKDNNFLFHGCSRIIDTAGEPMIQCLLFTIRRLKQQAPTSDRLAPDIYFLLWKYLYLNQKNITAIKQLGLFLHPDHFKKLIEQQREEDETKLINQQIALSSVNEIPDSNEYKEQINKFVEQKLPILNLSLLITEKEDSGQEEIVPDLIKEKLKDWEKTMFTPTNRPISKTRKSSYSKLKKAVINAIKTNPDVNWEDLYFLPKTAPLMRKLGL